MMPSKWLAAYLTCMTPNPTVLTLHNSEIWLKFKELLSMTKANKNKNNQVNKTNNCDLI
jgi:hypothetical protein